MEITIFRTNSNRLYTEGYMSINGAKTTSTVENTSTILPDGRYEVKLKGSTLRRRQLAILMPSHVGKPFVPYTVSHFEVCGSWISSKKNKSICIGESIIPGALKKGSEVFERLFDRIEKAEQRGEKITLDIITSVGIIYGEPLQYWLEPNTHGCPPSNRHVEKDFQGNVFVYDGDTLIREFPAEQADIIEATSTLNA